MEKHDQLQEQTGSKGGLQRRPWAKPTIVEEDYRATAAKPSGANHADGITPYS